MSYDRSRSNQENELIRQIGSSKRSQSCQRQKPNQSNQQFNSNSNSIKKKKIFIARLPKFISFNDKNSYFYSQLKYVFPKNKTFCIDFYPKAQVPVTYIDSSNEQKLKKHINDHKQDMVLVDIEWASTDSISLFEICSKKGVLLIHNSGTSDLIVNFLKTTPFYTKGSDKVLRLKDYVKTSTKLAIIDIDEQYIKPKRYPSSFDYLLKTFLSEPNHNFKSKDIFDSNFSDIDLTCNQVMYCAYKAVSEFMLIPIVKSVPKTIGEINETPQQLEMCIQMPFSFDKSKVTKVTFIPDIEEEKQFILPMIEKLYDGKAFVEGSLSNKIFGYGTSYGILITQKAVSPFKHACIQISEDAFDERAFNSFVNQIQWKKNKVVIKLAFYIYSTLKAIKKRPADPVKGNAKFPSFAKYKPARFDTPSDIPHRQIVSKFTILQIPINSDLYLNFALSALENIQNLQEEGFNINIPQANSFDIDEMCESLRNDDISDEFELKIKEFINSFKKVDIIKLKELLKDVEPRSNEVDAYERIIESGDFNDLSESDIKILLTILDRVFKRRNECISQLCSIKAKKNNEINSLMNELLDTICPSNELTRKVNMIMAKYSFDFDEYQKSLNKVKKHIQKMNINLSQKIELDNLYMKSLVNLIQFVHKNADSFDQIQLIIKAFLNLKNFVSENASPEEINLFVENAKNMMNAVNIYINFLNSNDSLPIKIIENILFKLIFTPSDYGYFTQVYSVYQMHDKFLFDDNPFVNFKSSTGSGKTRCAPFFFSIKALIDQMKRPFFIMTQPGASIIIDKMKDFKSLFGKENVILVNNVKDMLTLYTKGVPKKPVVALFSPHNALRLLVEAENAGIDIISKTRFCLDEIHERSVDTDVFIAKLTQKIKQKETFPLQVLMMSATPDSRVLNCFGRVKKLELTDSHLFPIETIKREVDSKNMVSDEAADQTIKILKDMAHGNVKLGHILVFTSGNSRINEISYKISERIEKTRKELKKEIESSASTHKILGAISDDDDDVNSFTRTKRTKIIRNIQIVNNPPLTDMKAFYNYIKEITKRDNTTLFVVLIKFAGFVSSAQKEIAKNIIRNHNNVIKIILATNAIESSITIDQLSAVVDTGIFNQPQFDTQRGLTKLSEEAISIQSQTQRKGRVGRVRPGISIQISIKNNPFKEFLLPEILTTDISSNILSLRKVGIKLESITNLPDPIDPRILNQFMNELYSIKAIDKKTGELTELGKKISQFESLSPFLAASIMRAASCATTTSLSQILEILGSLIVLIFNSTDLVVDPFAEPLQDNFNSNSDIITVLKTFLDLVNHKSWKLKATKYGLSSKAAQGIFSTINTISENLKIPQEEKHVFIQLKEIINRINLMQFIQIIINSIEKYKSSWIQCRKATFMTIDNIRTTPSLIYVGDKSLAFDDDLAQSEIMLTTRPGAKGLISPGAAYIFNISHNESMSTNYGSCIHRNIKDNPIEKTDEYKFIKPKIIKYDISLYAQEEFASCLLNVFLQGHEAEFRKFNALKHTGIESGNIFFYPSIFKGKCIITYAPNSEKSNETFKRALIKTIQLLPYTPSTIIIRHKLLHCAIAVRYLTIDKPNSSIYFFNQKDCYPYQINQETLDFILKHVNELSCAQNQIFIAITGENLSIPLDSENVVNSNSIRRPTVDPKCNYVFSDDPYFYNHMVILSDKIIPGQKPIPWTKDGIYADYAPSEYITKVANGIFPDLLSVKECEKMIFFTQNGVTIDGNFPKILTREENFYYEQNTKNRSVDAMFDRFAMGCIDNYKLSKDVDLNSFAVNGPTIPESLIHYHSIKNELIKFSQEEYNIEYERNSNYFKRIEYSKQHPNEYESTRCKMQFLNNKKSDIIQKQRQYSNLDFGRLSKAERSRIITEQANLKNERTQVENDIQMLKRKLENLKIPKKPDMNPTFIEIYKIIKSPIHFSIAKKLCQTDYHISLINKKGEIALGIPNTIGGIEKANYINSFLNLIRPLNAYSSYKQEEVPLYEVTFNHAKNSSLSQEEFRKRIENVSKKFGAVILRISKYKESNSSHNPSIQGHVYVYMFSATFTIPFASMTSDEIFGKNTSVLRIPIQVNIDIYALARDNKMCTIMKNWIASNDLDIQFVHNKWIGPKSDVEKAIELLKSSPPEFPTKTISIPGGVDLIRLNSKVQKEMKLGKKKWFVNIIRKTIAVPSETEEDEVKEFIEKFKHAGKQAKNDEDENENEDEDEIIGDVGCCGEEAVLSTKLINVYNNETKKVQSKNFCRSCIRDSFVSILGQMYDENNDIPIMNKIYENIDYIQPITLFFSSTDKWIPLGQLIWSFIVNSDIATPARTYITAIALHTLRKSPFITFCPQHPSIIFKKPPLKTELKCIVSSCNYHLCPNCNKWHMNNTCPKKQPIPLGDRVCPNCHAIIEKTKACNHLHCNCGKHFCYYCGEGPWDNSEDCYKHLSEEHKNCFNDPPDYRKYIKHDNNVTDKELEEFYKKYPKWINFKI